MGSDSSLTSHSRQPSTSAEPAPTAPRSPSRQFQARSCYVCRRRKIRCDKSEPCSACAKGGQTCEYPAAGPRVRRTRRTIIADMTSRISELERSLAKAQKAVKVQRVPQPLSPSPRRGADLSNLGQDPGASKTREEDVIVQKGSSSQYFNEVLLSRVIRREQDIESALTPPSETPRRPVVPSPYDPAGIISPPSPSILPHTLHPSSDHAVRLWAKYIDSVEACAGLKLLHVPTDELIAYSVINDPAAASFEHLALSFAVSYASTITLEPAEAALLFGCDKITMLLRLKLGLEQSFAHGSFLDRPTVGGLHALAIYLAALRHHNRGKGLWILNGLSIRIAQSLGLHRDGKRLGLSPYQSEIRRRLWWHLVSRDSRAGEDYGLENTNNPLLTTEVDMPLNIHDSDLTPELSEMPKPRQGWTAMTFSLIAIEYFKAMQKMAILAASSTASCPPSEATRLEVLQQLRESVEPWLAQCNPLIPQQRLTLFCTRLIIRKTDFVTRLQWVLLQQRAGLDSDFATEDNLAEALDNLDLKLYTQDGLLTQFRWTRRAFPQYNITLYVLLHLCLKPEGPNVERAWKAVDSFFADEMPDETAAGYWPKLLVLQELRRKAQVVRDTLLKSRPARPRDPEKEAHLRVASSQEVMAAGLEGDLPLGVPASMMDTVGLEACADWPDWANLVQDFQLDAPDIFLQ
ncbi:hypothetical protein BD289DRAFT_428665 [Coniella lustricola]|uniref:Zn(2)-C6 fungal-type domain-containing protein n=1 Tax=Coniella lustricola TaxID=2025994 RepID=A0A2T3ADU0_9PEZI|nr:hypothetical protein BD289DRAFT_428665 [Coniella lustricola]